MNITESRRNGDGVALKGEGLVNEIYPPFSRIIITRLYPWMAPFDLN